MRYSTTGRVALPRFVHDPLDPFGETRLIPVRLSIRRADLKCAPPRMPLVMPGIVSRALSAYESEVRLGEL